MYFFTDYKSRILSFFKGPVEVMLTEPPIISITEDGLSANVHSIAQSLVEPIKPPLSVVN